MADIQRYPRTFLGSFLVALWNCGTVKNLTISLEDDVYRRTRVIAAEADTSVTALVREFLTVLTNGKQPTGAAEKAILIMINRLRSKHPHFDPGERLDRESIHSRAS